jgi:hypothetical protein
MSLLDMFVVRATVAAGRSRRSAVAEHGSETSQTKPVLIMPSANATGAVWNDLVRLGTPCVCEAPLWEPKSLEGRDI